MGLFEDAKKLSKMEVGEERKDVTSCTVQSVTHHDHFIHTLEIEYMDKKRENVVLPPGRMIVIDIVNYEGLKSEVLHFPIQIIGDEVWNRTPVIPYIRIGDDGNEVYIPSKLKLMLLRSKMWNTYIIQIDKE